MTCWFLANFNFYDNRGRLLLKQFICWIFTLDRCVPGKSGIFQGCGAVVKMSQIRFRSYSIHEHGFSSGALGFLESISSSGFYSFSHINILIVFVCLKLNGKLIKSSTQNQENIAIKHIV